MSIKLLSNEHVVILHDPIVFSQGIIICNEIGNKWNRIHSFSTNFSPLCISPRSAALQGRE